ncbi:MAG TPA: histidine kinase [Anaerolineaceae bacterium]|nr:histidine kinase [Anaerolineaceae bacterium]
MSALVILVASLPGYLRFISEAQVQPVDASPVFIKAVRSASALASIGTACLSIILAGILFWRKRTETMALFVSFFLLGFGVILGGPMEAIDAFKPGNWASLVLVIQSAVITIPFMLIFFLFPNGKFVPRWTRFVALTSLIYILLAFFLPPSTLFTFNTPLISLASSWYLLLIILGVYAQVFRYRRISTSQERQQTKWFVYGLFMWLLLSIIVSIPYIFLQNLPMGATRPWWAPLSQLGWFLTLMIIPLSLAIAVMRYRLWDIDLLISRTLIYAVLTAIVIIIYILLVGGLSALFQLSGNLLVSLFATGLIAILFQPLRDRLQRGINRLVYGDRGDPVIVLRNLGQRLSSVVTQEAVLPTVVESISQALRLSYVAVTLKEGEDFVPAATCGQLSLPDESIQLLPLNYQSETIGQLIVSRRSGDGSFTAVEKALLQNIAHQVGIAAYAVQLTRDLQHSREQLVAAREEERRRIRRDLHDGLGPSLASLTLKIDAARNLMKENQDKAESILVALKSQTQSALEDIRRLAYDLRPPALDELGLLFAIKEYAINHMPAGVSVQFEQTGEFSDFPAAVEVAAYRITCEALTNVARHAQASRCTVRLVADGELLIEVEDDGLGFAEGAHRGIGTWSMHERAEELGGTCQIEPGLHHGTRVTAHLPL